MQQNDLRWRLSLWGSVHNNKLAQIKSTKTFPVNQDTTPKPNTNDTMSRFESDNSLRLYLREISKTDLLTPQEEVKLAARIKKGEITGGGFQACRFWADIE